MNYQEAGKVCTACAQFKPLTEFYKDKKGYLRLACRVCCAAAALEKYHRNPALGRAACKRWHRNNPAKVRARSLAQSRRDYACPVGREKIKQRNAKYNAAHPEKRRERNRRAILKAYGLTLDQYAALLTSQNGVCAICGKEGPRRLAVDHCHQTNTVRGLLCVNCNTALGSFFDQIENLKSAIRYLERASCVS